MSIASLLNQVQENEIVLPAIQRDFVWPKERIFKLLDSVMRGYPIGTILLWETYSDIQYRMFVSDYRSGNILSYHDNPSRNKLRLVVDGQQRLQSLYVGLYGTYEGNPLYFDVLSGRDHDDVSEQKYVFAFRTTEEIEKSEKYLRDQLAKSLEDRDEEFEIHHYMRVSELFSMGAPDKERLKEDLAKSLALEAADRVRLSVNLALLDQALSKEGDLLKETVIDKDLPSTSPSRKTDHDVLEIFVRVNTENTRLSRSDLIFSMLKLNWKESATVLPEFIAEINRGNSFDIDHDFVIRCLFAVSNLGTKFDIDLLRKKTNVEILRANFEECCNAVRSTLDFVQTHCWCSSSDLIGSQYTLVPFVYYLFNVKDHVVPKDQISAVRKALFLLAFAKPFSRYGEGRVSAYIRDALRPLVKQGISKYPWEDLVRRVGYWENIHSFEDLLKGNHVLGLHLVQGLSGAAVKYERNAPEIDHIFPYSGLKSKEFDPTQINHFANFWILAKSKNQNKSNQHPADYFSDVDEIEMTTALIEREYLDYRRYTTFLSHRAERMIEKVQEKIGFSGNEFDTRDGEGE